MISIFDAIILGFIQGLTEFLPVSSTGHLILGSKLLGVSSSIFSASFIIAIQVGSILAVLLLYGRAFFNWELSKRVLAAFIPTAIIGWLIYKIVKTFLLHSDITVALMLVLGGVAMIAVEHWYARRNFQADKPLSALSYREAIIIGLAQALAMIPGVSRSAATIFGGLTLGLSRAAIVEFSFLLAIPTMLAATGYDLLKSGNSFSTDQFGILLLGTMTSFIVSWWSIKWLVAFIGRHDFTGFGIYRIVVGATWLFFFWLV